jgi:hypothetical protein
VASSGINCQTEENTPTKNLEAISVVSGSGQEDSHRSYAAADASPAKDRQTLKSLIKEIMRRDAGILRNVKKELEAIYKDLILILFSEKKDEEHSVKTERKVNMLIMQINDQIDEVETKVPSQQ